MTAPTIAERIAEYLGNGGLWNPEAMEHDKVRTLLIDCRDYLQSIESQPVPGEPECIGEWRHAMQFPKAYDHVHIDHREVVTYIDSLQSELQRAQEERDELQKRFDIEVEAFYAERERAEKAEAIRDLVVAAEQEHGGNHHEPECPICVALAKFNDAGEK